MKKILKWICKLLIIGFITLFIFELSYRFSIIDFYKSEFNALNPKEGIAVNNVDYLVFGDSFSAAGKNYIDFLREESNKTFINSSVPGLGIKQVNTFANRRIKKFNPKKIIYQIYVGNDLTDVNHLTNYKQLSIIRNLYWDISDMFISVSYINFKLGQFSPKKNVLKQKRNIDTIFNVKSYNARSKLYFTSDPEYLYKTVTIQSGFEKRYSKWIKKVKKFIDKIPKNTQVYLVFIPHCAQLNSFYLENIGAIGATFPDQDEFNKINYGFFEKTSLDLKAYTNVSLLNPLENLRQIDSIDNRLYYLNDPHLNAKGQQVIGMYLKEYLKLNKNNL